MNSPAHPSDDNLARYAETPTGAGFDNVRLHLIACADCRQLVDRLSALPEQLRAQGPYLESMPTADAGESGDEDLAARLHRSSHARAMRAASASRDEAAPPRRTAATGRWRQAWTWRVPLWCFAPLTAALVAALSIGLLPMSAPDLQLISYRDQPGLTLETGIAPGLGFFNAAGRRQLPFEPVVLVRESPHRLRLDWPAVADADSYRLSLFRIHDGEAGLLRETETRTPGALLSFATALPASRYEWRLQGVTGGGDRFSAAGGFVLGETIQ